MQRKQFLFHNDEGEMITGELPLTVKTYPLPDEVVTAAIDTLSQCTLLITRQLSRVSSSPEEKRLCVSVMKAIEGLRQDLGFSPKGE